MAKWTNKYKIMEDLSVAQGRIVPASFQATFGENCPPASGIIEETEEEYYKDCIGDGDFASGPDISLIQEMLSLVRDHTISSDDDSDKVIVISKLNSTNPVMPSTQPETKKAHSSTQLKKKLERNRNVAINSLLNNIEKVSDTARIDDVQDVKAEVNDKKSTLTERRPMFRRKRIENPSKPVSQAIVPRSIQQPSYVPSTHAKDYYEKYMENNKKIVIQEDIWSRLERELKVIDEKKRQEALMLSSPSTSSQASCDDATLSSPSAECGSALDKVCLPQQRHLLTTGRDCAVCEVFKKNVYDIKETL